MGRAKFGSEHQPHNWKKARKDEARAGKQAESELELAEFRGLTVRRMNAAPARITTTGTGTDRRKPHNCKADAGKIRFQGENRIEKGDALTSTGVFIQYGARTKEGQLELKQRSQDDKRKVWTQGYATETRRYGMAMHDATNSGSTTTAQPYKVPGFTY